MLNIDKTIFGLVLIMLFGFGSLTWAAETSGAAPAAPEQDWTQLDADEEELVVWDPIEPFNRGMFWFNDKLYFSLIKPVARGYRVVTPEPVRESVGNVFRNLAAPVRIANALLQLKGLKATDELLKCLFNTTFGLGGLFDLGVSIQDNNDGEDFGQTLGRYGTPPGFYLVLPVLGPSNARDLVGRMADSLTHPIPSPYYLKLQQLEATGAQVTETVNALSLDKDTYEAIKKDALDPYLFVRDAYMQNRAARIDK